MLHKLTCIVPTSKTGILKIRFFELYSKKRFQKLSYYGVTKGSVAQSNRFKKYLSGYKIKSYVVQTKQTLLRLDGSTTIFYKNKTCIKNKKLQRKKKNYGPVQKNIKHRKFLFKFTRVI